MERKIYHSMHKTILLLLISFCAIDSSAQGEFKNALSTSPVRLELNSHTLHLQFYLKFLTAFEYQRLYDRWSFGVKYEHGLNAIEEDPYCEDCFYGTGYLQENNVYLSAYYSLFSIFNERVEFNTGFGLYYSHLNYSGDFDGGFTGRGAVINSTYNTIGVAPSIVITYDLSPRFFFSLHSNARYGYSKKYDA